MTTPSGSGPASQLGPCAVRLTRIKDTTGVPDYGNSKGAFMMCGGVSKIAYDFDVQKGTDIYEEDGCGNAVVIRKRHTRTKASTFTMTMAKNDDRMVEISGLGVGLTVAGEIIGHAIQAGQGCGAVDPSGCIIEFWVEQVDCDVPKSGAPYKRYIIPWALLTPKGSEFANKTNLPIYEGFGQVNPFLDDGPFGDWPSLVGVSNVVWAAMDDTAIPVCASPLDYVALPADS